MNKNEKKTNLMISITQANTEPWLSIWHEGQEKTWMQKYNSTVNIVNCKSETPPKLFAKFDFHHEKLRYHLKLGRYISILDKILALFIPKKIPTYTYNKEKKLLEVKSMSIYILTNRRNLALFKFFVEETNCHFLFQTNTSSYVNCENLMQLLNKFKSETDLYAGYIVEPDSPRKFVSGAGRLMSRRTVELILKNYKKYPHNNLEDVSVGDFLRVHSVTPIELPRLDIPNLEILNRISDKELSNNFIYRCKSDTIPRKDVEIMLNLHDRLNKIY
jgi:IS1 family transposase